MRGVGQRGRATSCRLLTSCTPTPPPLLHPLQSLAAAGKGRVFATDTIIASIMCMRSAVYGWDVIATRKVGACGCVRAWATRPPGGGCCGCHVRDAGVPASVGGWAGE